MNRSATATRQAPTDVHAAERVSTGDIHFLYGIADHLNGAMTAARAVHREGHHPDVGRLANDILATHGAHLVTVDGLKARLNSATAGASTSTSVSSSGASGHGGGQGGGNGGRSAEFRADTKQPYGNVTYADPGYQSDGVKRYPLDSAAHCRAAWSYINMPKNASKYSSSQLAQIKGRIRAAAKKFGIEISDQANSASDWEGEVERSSGRTAEFERAVPFEMEPSRDGLTLAGYAAVFDSPAQVRDLEGPFEEVIRPGAFRDSLERRMPVLMFEHGRHPLIGTLPLGVLERAEEDARGLYIEARLTDNWLIQPVRDAIRDGAIDGMSFRLTVPEGGDRWTRRTGKPELREVLQINTRELGPVVFPAYELTTATVRAALDCIDCNTGRPGARSAAGGDPSRAAPGNGNALPLSDARIRDRMLRWNARRVLSA